VSESQWCVRDRCTNVDYYTAITVAKFLVAHNGLASVRMCQHILSQSPMYYRDAEKSLTQPGRKQATATEDFDVHVSYLSS
jgi:hypothetical protein